jgi:hypothetical protein
MGFARIADPLISQINPAGSDLNHRRFGTSFIPPYSRAFDDVLPQTHSCFDESAIRANKPAHLPGGLTLTQSVAVSVTAFTYRARMAGRAILARQKKGRNAPCGSSI